MKANASGNPRTRLGEEEVLSQMHNLTAAAQETTSSTLSWMLYELAKRPDYQARIRAEIRAGRARVAERGTGAGFILEDLDGMQMMLAAIKVRSALARRDILACADCLTCCRKRSASTPSCTTSGASRAGTT